MPKVAQSSSVCENAFQIPLRSAQLQEAEGRPSLRHAHSDPGTAEMLQAHSVLTHLNSPNLFPAPANQVGSLQSLHH